MCSQPVAANMPLLYLSGLNLDCVLSAKAVSGCVRVDLCPDPILCEGITLYCEAPEKNPFPQSISQFMTRNLLGFESHTNAKTPAFCKKGVLSSAPKAREDDVHYFLEACLLVNQPTILGCSLSAWIW